MEQEEEPLSVRTRPPWLGMGFKENLDNNGTNIEGKGRETITNENLATWLTMRDREPGKRDNLYLAPTIYRN